MPQRVRAGFLAALCALGFVALFTAPSRADLGVVPAPVSQTPATGDGAWRIYVSLPRRGANASTSRLIVKGLRAALGEREHVVSGERIKLVHLNDADGRRWKTWKVKANARRALADRRAVAYVGELNSEASAIAQPILANGRMAMFAPVSTAPSLTDLLAGRPRRAVLFRSIPTDADQADALALYLRRSGVRRFALIEDGALYGQGLAASVAGAARERGVKLVLHRRMNRDGRRLKALTEAVARKRPRAVLFTGSLSSSAVSLFRALNEAVPQALLFGGDALAHDSFARRLEPSIQRRVRLTAPSARANPRRTRKLGLGRRPDAVTLFAYEGMAALLDAIERSKALVSGQPPFFARDAIRSAVFAGRVNRGLIAPWRVEPSGDSSNRVFSAIRLRGGRVVDRGRLVAHGR